MTRGRGLWLMLPKQLRNLPADLTAVLTVVALTNLTVFLPVLNETPVRIIVGLAFVLFIPGYAFIAALFPETGEAPTRDDEAERTVAHDTDGKNEGQLRDRGIDGIERIALSFGLSVAIVPLIGLALNFTPFGVRLVPILVSLSGFTVITTAIAAKRRWSLPEDERFRVPYREWYAAGKSEIFAPASTADAALNVALGVAMLVAISSVVYAVAVPPQGEQFTEFYVLSEDSDGELVADNYPEELVAGEPASLHVGIENREYETIDYTVVVQLQEVAGEGNASTVTNRAEIDRWSTTLPGNESKISQREFVVDDATAAEFEGADRRLAFLLYNGAPPTQPTRENSYRNLHLWVNVTADESAS
ncbi:DUF1616 domain-containing protein [Natronomonas halophila]|uniref:DUF1616 domain-containing protein n=1 Tax=Natronomonas halophila TaxID=2747817 RepID=UPI0015B50171|nr:DUF1616 domain-containing protein [Natronomonas halophila]QLD87051.1 DUF1616 domain-containing protein [Natronomonas halophila]